MVVCVHAHLLEVVMLAADAQTFLRVGHTLIFRSFVAKNNILELIHSGVGKHQRGVIFNNHRSRRHDVMPLAFEKAFERLTYFFSCQHIGDKIDLYGIL